MLLLKEVKPRANMKSNIRMGSIRPYMKSHTRDEKQGAGKHVLMVNISV